MTKPTNFYGNNSAEHLKNCIERIENIQSEIANLQDDKKSVFDEAKGAGFDTKVIRKILGIRKMDKAELLEFEYLFDTYRQALGMIPDLFDENQNPAIKENDLKVNITIGDRTFENVDMDKLNKIASKPIK